MKKIMFFSLLAVLIVFSSCKLDEGYSEYTPAILFGNPAKLNSDTSLYFKSINDSYAARIDSIHVGDTLKIKVGMNAYYNQLSQFDFSVNDSTAIKMILPDSLEKVFKTIDNKLKRYTFKENITVAILPLKFVALKASDSIEYKFNVNSNVTKVPNSSTIGFRTKIKNKFKE